MLSTLEKKETFYVTWKTLLKDNVALSVGDKLWDSLFQSWICEYN